jgi:hypothetical protein
LGGDMIEGLCLLREAVVREQERRAAPDTPRSAQGFLRCGAVPTAATPGGHHATS